jgi:plastocyanin
MGIRTRFRSSVAALLLGAGTASVAADLSVQLTNNDGKPLAEAVVFVPVAGPAARPPVARRATIVQHNRLFEPFVTVIGKGAAVDFPNEDTMLHHVYSFSPAKRFEIKLYKGTPAKPVVFDTPGIVTLGCNVHDWMLAYVVVVDTPYFAKTGPKGVARIANVPAGAHDLMGWYPGMREPVLLRQVALPEDAERQIDQRLDVPIRTRPPAPPLDPMRY